jgi:hypothetical protein
MTHDRRVGVEAYAAVHSYTVIFAVAAVAFGLAAVVAAAVLNPIFR